MFHTLLYIFKHINENKGTDWLILAQIALVLIAEECPQEWRHVQVNNNSGKDEHHSYGDLDGGGFMINI